MTTIYGNAPETLCEFYPTFNSQIARLMGPTWGPPGSCRPQMGPMLDPWTLLSGLVSRLMTTVCYRYLIFLFGQSVYYRLYLPLRRPHACDSLIELWTTYSYCWTIFCMWYWCVSWASHWVQKCINKSSTWIMVAKCIYLQHFKFTTMLFIYQKTQGNKIQ